MIAPAISPRAVSARLDAMPDRLRAALASEIERLGRELRDRLGRRRRLSLVIDSTGDIVTAAILLRTAGARIARLQPRRPQSRFPRRRLSLPSVAADMLPDIRAGLEAAAREAIRR